ncbi:MAG: hypothetical protein ACR2ML_13790 [Solirubrobacteraceae bacterium]
MLHVRCGHDILGALEEAGIAGERLAWVDPVCQGPLDGAPGGAAWYAMRAAWIAARYGREETEVLADLRAQDDGLSGAGEHDEVVLWFEHDLFDQAILVRLLAWFDEHRTGGARLSLIDVEPLLEAGWFTGLGALGPAELAALFPGRRGVSEAQLGLGARTWAAMREPDPDAIEEVLADDTEALPHLRSTLIRLALERRPASDGLVCSERLALRAVAAGATSPDDAFMAVQDREEAPWMGDEMLWPVLADLAAKDPPLLEVSGGEAWPDRRLAVTEAGRALLTRA